MIGEFITLTVAEGELTECDWRVNHTDRGGGELTECDW